MIKIAPSILSADFARLGEQVAELEHSGLADWVHVDVMDGVFVPNLTIGPVVVSSIKRHTKLPLDVHLMIVEPHRYIDQFADAGADILTVHVEACPHIHRDLELIRRKGLKAGVSLNPGTPASAIEEILDSVDLVLVMTVDPGFGGQAFLEGQLGKVAKIRQWIDSRQLPVELSVDGGIKAANAPSVVTAGAQILVAGSAIFGHPGGIDSALKEIHTSMQSHC